MPVEEIIAKEQSYREARKVLDSVAKEGGYALVQVDPIMYSRTRDGTEEKLSIVKEGERTYKVVKILE